jgi:hypothetical protein
LIEVEARASLTPLLQIATQVAFLPGQDNGARLLAQTSDHGRHDETGQVMAHGTPKGERYPFPPVHVAWGSIGVKEVAELIGDAIRVMAAEGLIHQGNGQLFARWIRHHAGQTCGLLLFRRVLLLPGCA